MSKSYSLEEQEIVQDYNDGIISRDERDSRLAEIKRQKHDRRPSRTVDEDKDIGW